MSSECGEAAEGEQPARRPSEQVKFGRDLFSLQLEVREGPARRYPRFSSR